eukprot:3373341-Amphidinium_carterae.1
MASLSTPRMKIDTPDFGSITPVSTPPELSEVPTYPMTPAAHPQSYSSVPPLNFAMCRSRSTTTSPERSPDDQDSFSLSGHSFPKRRPGRGSPGPSDDDDDRDCKNTRVAMTIIQTFTSSL